MPEMQIKKSTYQDMMICIKYDRFLAFVHRSLFFGAAIIDSNGAFDILTARFYGTKSR
jgi:hypothetical protein